MLKLIDGFILREDEPEIRDGKRYRHFYIDEWCPVKNEWQFMICPQNKNGFSLQSEDENPAPDSQLDVNEVIKSLNERERWIIIYRNEYGDRYFDANSTESIGKVCMKIFEELKKGGIIEFPQKPVPPKFLPEDFDDDLELQDCVSDQWDRYNRDLSNYEKSNPEKAKFDKIQSGNARYVDCYNFLMSFLTEDEFCFHELESL